MDLHVSIRRDRNVNRADESFAIFLPRDHWLPESSHRASKNDGSLGQQVGVSTNNKMQLLLLSCLDKNFLLSQY